MERGRRYHQTPLFKKRRLFKRWFLLLFLILFSISTIEVATYFIHSYQNREIQTQLAREHQEIVPNDQKNETVTVAVSATAVIASEKEKTIDNPVVVPVASPVFFHNSGFVQEAMKPIIKQNNDTIGWITIDDIVDQPILYRDNTYYLTHDFYGKKNASGAIFLDKIHPLHNDTQNLLLWGHNMQDGSMFGRLIQYMTNGYLRKHNLIQFETRWESFTYIIFAVDTVSTDSSSKKHLSFWTHPTFHDENDFDNYIDNLYNISLCSRYLDVDYTDSLLTLATCYNDDRLILTARRQRSDETTADIQHAMLGLYNK